MEELIEYIIKSRNFILFALLEILCFYWINTSESSSSSYFSTANPYTSSVLSLANMGYDFLQLRQAHVDLKEEQQRLNKQWAKSENTSISYPVDTAFADRFDYIVGKVVNTSIHNVSNYITIDKGTDAGIRPGMSVITPKGIVGKIHSCNRQFSIITSILNTDFLISSRLPKADDIGTARWDGINSRQLKLNDISLNKRVSKGDSVVTSEHNSAFPPGVMIGLVEKTGKQINLTFYDITIGLSEHLTNLSFVYIIKSDRQSNGNK